MKVHCPNCQVAFSVPDDKIPQGKEFRLLCPKCRGPIELDRGVVAPPRDDSWEVGGESFLDDGHVPVDMLDDGTETLLLCVSKGAQAEKIENGLKGLNLHTNLARSVKMALVELRSNRYDVVILDEKFECGSRELNAVLRYIQPLPMQIRRQFFLCLLSDTLTTLDQITAFRIGVNLILSRKDLDKAKVILDRALKEHKRFCKVFREELDAKGRV